MGYSLSWIGVHAVAAGELYAKLGLAETGARGFFGDFPTGGLTAPNGWQLIVANGCEHSIISSRVLSALSTDAEVVACSIEEHVMYASAAFWQGGLEIWSVQHRGDRDIMDIVVKGSPPDQFEALRTRYVAEQARENATSAEVDYIFEIPLELARSIVPFRHDTSSPGIDDNDFGELQQEATGLLGEGGGRPDAPTPWWKFW